MLSYGPVQLAARVQAQWECFHTAAAAIDDLLAEDTESGVAAGARSLR